MGGKLGNEIGAGAMASVHAWAPRQVIKLFRQGLSERLVAHEARMTRAASDAGLPAPAVFGEAIADGRFGIVLSRFDGPTLMQLARTRTIAWEEAGSILANLAFSVHQTVPPADIPTLYGFMKAMLRASDISPHLVSGILSHLKRLAPGDGLCHGDLHPGNVIMAADGPKMIDWVGMVRAPAAYDLAICHVVLSELAPRHADDPERPRAVNAAMQREYARLAGESVRSLAASIAPYLPVASASAMLAGPWWLLPAGRQWLSDRIEAAVVSGDA